MFDLILTRSRPRNNVIAPTQDGKSLTIGAAVAIVAAATPEKFSILAPSEKKAGIIMSYIIDFVTQSPILCSQLELNVDEKLDRLRRERSRRHLTFLNGGGVQTLTLDAKNGKRNLEAVMGFGAKNIIADEAGLIDDVLWSTVMRMMGGYAYDETFLLKIGNPFYNNHFRRSAENPDYNQVKLTWRDSIADHAAGFHGFDPKFIEEMRGEPLFDVFYDCEFPDKGAVDADGYRAMGLDDLVKWVKSLPVERNGRPRLGCDIGGGGDLNVYVLRWDNVAIVIATNSATNTMVNVSEIMDLVDRFKIRWTDVNIDDIGVGRGVVDRLKEKNCYANGVAVGNRARQNTRYSNLRTELAFLAQKWLTRDDTVVVEDPTLKKQLAWLKFKADSDKLLTLEPKADLKKRTGKSPDHLDAFMLTFYEPPAVGII